MATNERIYGLSARSDSAISNVIAGYSPQYNATGTSVYNVGTGTNGVPGGHVYLNQPGHVIIAVTAYGAAAVASSVGPDFITNGAFASDTAWTKGTGWTIAAGVANCDGTQIADSDLSQDPGFEAGKTYIVTFTTTRSAGTVTLVVGGTVGTARSTANTFNETIVAGSSDTLLAFRADSDFVGTIDNVSISEQSTGFLLIEDENGSTISGDAIPSGFSFAEGVEYQIGPHKSVAFSSGAARIKLG